MAPLVESASELSSLSSGNGVEKVNVCIHFGGYWKRQFDGSSKYIGGETYLEKVPGKWRYADLIYHMSEKANGAVTLKYTPPGEEADADNMVTCVDDGHVQVMFEDYFKVENICGAPGKTFRLQIWLFSAEEEVVTPEEIRRAKSVRSYVLDRSTSRRGNRSNSSSFGSNSSAGTGPHHLSAGRPDCPSSPTQEHPSDVEMQEREAEEAVTWMNHIEQAELKLGHPQESEQGGGFNASNWQHQLTHNLCVAHERTYDSCGWPHDRSPFVKALQKQGSALFDAEDDPSFPVPASPRLPFEARLGSEGTRAGDEHARVLSMNEAGNRPPHLLHASASAPRMFTQDPYKHTFGGEMETDEQHLAELPSIHLPSHLGSDMGNVAGATSDLRANECHMDAVVMGIVDYVIQDGQAVPGEGPAPPLPSGFLLGAGEEAAPAGKEAGGERGLQRAASRAAVSQNNVFRIPQAEVKVVSVIGEGTFGDVVLASHSVFGKVAVKWLKPGKMDKHGGRFWEEAHMLAALNHPNVLRFYGVVTGGAAQQAVVGIMTEYMPGGPLSHYLVPGGPRLPLGTRAELARAAVNGLAYLHHMNIVHFDLKPDNLLLDHSLHPGFHTPGIKVADFGLSKQKFSKYVSGVRDLRGTLPYMAPELVSDPDHVTEAADVWSLGVVLWEMLSMETPFADLTPQGIISGLMMGQLKPETPADCEPEWQALLEGCLQANPSARLTLHELGQQLDAIIDQSFSFYTTS